MIESHLKIPNHIAIIMDGNGRWAQERGLSRIEGHKAGAETVRSVIEMTAKLKIKQLTLYCFSTENWKRPPEEINALFILLKFYLEENRSLFLRDNIKIEIIGRRHRIPEDVLEVMDDVIHVTADNTGLVLRLAINYGGRAELVDAFQKMIQDYHSSLLTPEDITEETISNHLYTTGYSDPDLLIRTGNEHRLSNFLLWQASYSEIWFSKCYWPDFDEKEFHAALDFYATKERRYGAVSK